MFTFQSALSQAVTGSKQVLSTVVQDKDIRKNLESVIDAQASLVTTVFETSLDLAKQVVEQLGTSEYTKPYAELAKKFTTV